VEKKCSNIPVNILIEPHLKSGTVFAIII